MHCLTAPLSIYLSIDRSFYCMILVDVKNILNPTLRFRVVGGCRLYTYKHSLCRPYQGFCVLILLYRVYAPQSSLFIWQTKLKNECTLLYQFCDIFCFLRFSFRCWFGFVAGFVFRVVEFYLWPVLDKISKLLTGHKEIQVALTHGPRLDSDGNVVMFSIRVSTERCV